MEGRYKGNDKEAIQSNSTSCPKHQTGKGHLQLRLKQKQQEDSSFPTDGHKAILNKLNGKSKTNRKRSNIVN